MTPRQEASPPFAALIGASSLLAALLYVAGFSYRWSYLYNFGVQHLVFKFGFQSFLIAALELLRTPRNLGLLLLWVVLPLLALNLALAALAAATDSPHRALRRLGEASRGVGLQSQLPVELLRAGLIVYATYRVASLLGYETFVAHLRNHPSHPLPSISVVLGGDKGNPALALACGAAPDAASAAFIGDGQRLQRLQTFLRSCSSGDKVVWRLLYRDDEEIYLFAAEEAGAATLGRRPLTLVLPNRGNVALAME